MPTLPVHRRARLPIEAGVLSVLLALAFLALGRPSWFGDARGLLALHENDAWLYHHRAYFPLARLVRALTPLDAEGSLRALSALAAGAGCALTYAAARRLGNPRSVALAVTGLLAASPAVLFFATTIEVHALVLPFVGLALVWAAGAGRREPAWGEALVPSVLFLGLCAAHLAAALWIGGLGAVWLWSGRRLRWPRHGAAALVVLAVGGYAIFFLGRESGAGFGRLVLAGLRDWSPEPLARELLARSGILIPLALVAALRLRREKRALWIFAPPVLAVIVAYAVLLSGLRLREEGGYFLALHPLLALLAAPALDRVRPGATRAGALAALVGVQVLLAARHLHAFETRYEHAAWVEPLARELAHGGGVLTFTEREAHAVLFHAPRAITAASPDTGPLRPTDLGSQASVDHALFYAERVRAQGGRLAITRSLYEAEERGAPGLVRHLVERFGAPAPGEHGEYLVFPAAQR